MRPGEIAEAALRLGWVPPTVPALLTLARRPTTDAWTILRQDPGIVLLLLRNSPAFSSSPFSSTDAFRDPEPLRAAVRLLAADDADTLPDWSVPGRAEVRAECLRYARAARQLAGCVPGCDPDQAWVAGLLAPLGWLAVAAVDPVAASECLSLPASRQRQQWGHDHSEIARRLARRWLLPSWMTALLGRLGMPPHVVRELRADLLLFQVVQLAVALVQQKGLGLSLCVGGTIGDLAQSLSLPASSLSRMLDIDESSDPEIESEGPRLLDVVRLAAENRWLEATQGPGRLESELDTLHRSLEEQRTREETRLRERKLSALAEFAAGAGHEINNPLAVISGQAQYLLGHEGDQGRRTALEKIIGQTQRIHQLLRDVMQFARPGPANRQPMDLNRLVDEVAYSLSGFAEERKVQLKVREDASLRPGGQTAPCMIHADAGQLRVALTSLMRNAVEAAHPEGWASVRVTPDETGHVEVLIEDSGRELPQQQREHLFDPFYSGRSAGRGAGLGLPTAWSLTRQQGGDVYLSSQPGEPTRFVLRLPLPPTDERPVALAG